jgi:hypothetical protein
MEIAVTPYCTQKFERIRQPFAEHYTELAAFSSGLL